MFLTLKKNYRNIFFENLIKSKYFKKSYSYFTRIKKYLFKKNYLNNEKLKLHMMVLI